LDGADEGDLDDSGIVEPMVADAIRDDDLLEAIAADAAGDDVDSLLDAVAADAAKHDVYNEQIATNEAGGTPETHAEALTAPEGALSKKKGGGKRKDAAPVATGEKKEAAPPKVPRATSLTHKPGELLLYRPRPAHTHFASTPPLRLPLNFHPHWKPIDFRRNRSGK